MNYRTPTTHYCYFGLSLSGNYLLKYTETFPAAVGKTTSHLGTTRTQRYIDHVYKTSMMPDNRLGHTFYGDLRLTFTPVALQHNVEFTVGANNLFNKNPRRGTVLPAELRPDDLRRAGKFGRLRVAVKLESSGRR